MSLSSGERWCIGGKALVIASNDKVGMNRGRSCRVTSCCHS
jgi:hypothetical protein